MSKKRINPLTYLFFVLASLLFAMLMLGRIADAAELFDLNRFSGEEFEYTIKKFGIQAGTATLEYRGMVDFEGGQVVLIVFRADGFNFLDEEIIYADPETLLPLRIERDLNIFGNKERLIEFYDAVNNQVRIVKYKGGKQVDEMVFKKEQPIDNLYCFLFRYRLSGKIQKGKTFEMFLPTKDVKFEIVKKQRISFYPGADEAWFMQSRPKEYRVWFGTGNAALPLRIDGAMGLASTAMILKNYHIKKIE